MIFLISHNRFTEPYPVYPLGMAEVATHLWHQKIPFEVADRIVDTEQEIFDRIRATAPKVIGISIRNLHSFQSDISYDSVGELKRFVSELRVHSNAPIVLGGSAINLYPVEITEWAGADYGIVEDPQGMSKLYRCLESGEDFSELPNLVIAANPKKLTLDRKQIDDQMPTRLLDRRYVDYYYRHGGMLNLLTRRGCPFRCSFCTYPLIEGHESRKKDVDRVVAEVENLLDHGVDYFFIVDSVFNANLKHSAAVAQAFIDRKLPIKWCAYMTPRPFPTGYPELLAKAGLTHIEFGTDAFSDEMLKVYRKPFRFSDVLKSSIQIRNAGVFQSHFMILGAPGETLATLDETFARSREIPAEAFIYCSGVQVYKGTGLYDKCLKDGLVSEDLNPLDPAILFGDSLTGETVDAAVEQHERTHPQWVTRAKATASKPIIDKIRSRGRIKGPMWELLNQEVPSFR